jgi:hypothetical protein
VPLPVPEAPEVTVIQPAVLTAVHAQLAVVVTATLPDPPGSENDWLGGAME